MRARPFYFVTCCLAVATVLIVGASKVCAGRAAIAAARAVASDSPDDREALHYVAHLNAVRSDRLSLVAAVVFVLAICGWLCSLWRREHGLWGVPLVILFLAGLLELLMV